MLKNISATEYERTKNSSIESELTEKVIGACIEVSCELGSGFLESAYLKALIMPLTQAGLKVAEQLRLKFILEAK